MGGGESVAKSPKEEVFTEDEWYIGKKKDKEDKISKQLGDQNDKKSKKVVDQFWKIEERSYEWFMHLPFVCFCDFDGCSEEEIKLEHLGKEGDNGSLGCSLEKVKGKSRELHFFYVFCMALLQIIQFRDHLDFKVGCLEQGMFINNVAIKEVIEKNEYLYYPVFFDFDSGIITEPDVIAISREHNEPLDKLDVKSLKEIEIRLFSDEGNDGEKNVNCQTDSVSIPEYVYNFLSKRKDKEIEECEKYYMECVKHRLGEKLEYYNMSKTREGNSKDEEEEKFYKMISKFT